MRAAIRKVQPAHNALPVSESADNAPGTPVSVRQPSSASKSITTRPAMLVAAGILLSRVVGLVRERVFGFYFGVTDEADAFRAAFRIPNMLQNLFGEGVLSASFIPVYASLIADGDKEEANRVAGAIFSILALVVSLLVLVGVVATPLLVDLIAAGFPGAKRDLTMTLVRVLFPGAGLLVLGAWCLGILNSHRKFFLSYAAPVIWNVAMIATLLWFGRRVSLPELAIWLAWGSVLGSALQMLVQLPTVLAVLGRLRLGLMTQSSHVREIVRNFAPVFVGRGVVQISAYVDAWIASLLIAGSVAALTYAQNLSALPVSLFGMAVSAAELPAMASLRGSDADIASKMRDRLNDGMRRIAFWIVPSSMAFLAIGDVVAGVIYQSGKFDRAVAVWVWMILGGSAVGLLATTLGRLYSSSLYALRDTKTPFRVALVRVALTLVLGYVFAIPLRRALGLPEQWGAAGLTISAGLAGWVEFSLLRRAVNARVGGTGIPPRRLATLWGSAAGAAAVALLIRAVAPSNHPLVVGAGIIGAYGATYFVLTFVAGVEDAEPIARRLRLSRRRPR
ncbi:MAG TPA: murein biosynthesis integral membrane protein MurJ [Gemmatimonadaceae bacterium]|nr:murein biosynthesis integral membrane protein MurJ [Gemmatimonadaceae bacterium]